MSTILGVPKSTPKPRGSSTVGGDAKLNDGAKPKTVQHALNASLAFPTLNVIFVSQVANATFAFQTPNITFTSQMANATFASQNVIFAFLATDVEFVSPIPNVSLALRAIKTDPRISNQGHKRDLRVNQRDLRIQTPTLSEIHTSVEFQKLEKVYLSLTMDLRDYLTKKRSVHQFTPQFHCEQLTFDVLFVCHCGF